MSHINIVILSTDWMHMLRILTELKGGGGANMESGRRLGRVIVPAMVRSDAAALECSLASYAFRRLAYRLEEREEEGSDAPP